MASRRRTTLWRTQNFLRSSTARRIVHDAQLAPGDVVLDLGAGRGSITAALVAARTNVVAVERDPELCHHLGRRFALVPGVTVACDDVLQVALPTQLYKVVANPPFDVITALVSRLTAVGSTLEDAFLVMQRRAADRYRGFPRETLYALLLKPWFEPTVVRLLERTDFRPMPSVDVVLVRLRKRGPPLVTEEEARLYRDFVVANFTSHGPDIRTALHRSLGNRAAQRLARVVRLDPEVRPGDVPFERWLDLFHAFAAAPQSVRVHVSGAERRLRRQQRRLVRRHRTRVPRDDPSGALGAHAVASAQEPTGYWSHDGARHARPGDPAERRSEFGQELAVSGSTEISLMFGVVGALLAMLVAERISDVFDWSP